MRQRGDPAGVVVVLAVVQDFFLVAFLAAFFAGALAAAGAASVAAVFLGALPAAGLSANTLSHPAQNFGFVPVLTIGPLITDPSD